MPKDESEQEQPDKPYDYTEDFRRMQEAVSAEIAENQRQARESRLSQEELGEFYF